jgi:hypothetical protein
VKVGLAVTGTAAVVSVVAGALACVVVGVGVGVGDGLSLVAGWRQPGIDSSALGNELLSACSPAGLCLSTRSVTAVNTASAAGSTQLTSGSAFSNWSTQSFRPVAFVTLLPHVRKSVSGFAGGAGS